MEAVTKETFDNISQFLLSDKDRALQLASLADLRAHDVHHALLAFPVYFAAPWCILSGRLAGFVDRKWIARAI